MTGPVRLSTRRLVLRDFVPADWSAVLAWAGDPLVAEPMAVEPFDAPAARAYVDRMVISQHARPRRRYELAIIAQGDGALVGACGLVASGGVGTLGYALARDRWGDGHATEAATAMVGLGFARLGLRRLQAACPIGHEASARVLGKLGFERRSPRWWEWWRTAGLWHFELTAAAWSRGSLPRPAGTASRLPWPISNASAEMSTAGSTPMLPP